MSRKYNITLNYFQAVFEEKNFTPEEFDSIRNDLCVFFENHNLPLKYIFQGNTENE
jgi:hypothetical protein